jgi:superoxide dismutase, Fe-Mn family
MTEEINQAELNRRDFLKFGAGAFATTIIPLANSAQSVLAEETMTLNKTNNNIQAKDFSPLVTIPPAGMSSRQINEHLGLYRKYVISLNKTQETEKKTGITHDTLINKGFAYGGTLLHELYFGNLSSKPAQLNYQSLLMQAIERDYGAYEGLINNFKEAGLNARGWAIFGLNLFDGKLNIYGMDSHNEGSALMFIWPIIVLDVYEHAYMIDHGTNKTAYLDNFMKNIDWSIGEARFLQGLKTLKNNTLII